MQDNKGEKLVYLAVDDRSRCKNNYPSVLSCIDKKTKEGCDLIVILFLPTIAASSW